MRISHKTPCKTFSKLKFLIQRKRSKQINPPSPLCRRIQKRMSGKNHFHALVPQHAASKETVSYTYYREYQKATHTHPTVKGIDCWTDQTLTT